jgi:hypothetical protein
VRPTGLLDPLTGPNSRSADRLVYTLYRHRGWARRAGAMGPPRSLGHGRSYSLINCRTAARLPNKRPIRAVYGDGSLELIRKRFLALLKAGNECCRVRRDVPV